MDQISDILKKKDFKGDPRNKYEYQALGNRLAEELNDPDHRSLYIKMARDEDRNLLMAARDYAIDAENISEKGRLFMWKFYELKKKKEDETEEGEASEVKGT